jgi:membrane protein involved in colicin uptake
MLARAGIDTALARPEPSFAGGLLVSAKYVVRAIGLLAVIGALTFGVTRCGMSGSVQQRSVIEARASEQAALQEYYQAHGVRPANMAELELMETARRRKENDARQADQERRRQDDEQRRFEQESRRRGEEIGYQLRLADEAASQRAERERERERELKFREEQLRLEIELTANPADRSRLELQRQQLRRQLQKP